MSTKMLINATHPEENRVAIVDDGILTNLDIEMAGRELTKGNIYKATVVRVEPGLQAAFVDYGGERYGFLQMGDLHQSFFDAYNNNPENKGRPRITDLLRRGQEIVVQVVKEERGTKGAALTTSLSLAGRYMVLMPGSTTKGISRKIEEESERKKLKQAMASLDRDSSLGYIVRTAGIGQEAEELHRDFKYLVRIYENIMSLSKRVKAPALIYKESNLVIRCIRDYFSAEMDEVLVDDTKVFQEAKDFFQEVMPEYARLVKLHQERRPIFARYQIEDQIDTISRNKVPMPSGGSIVIDATEALVAIDVNSGKMSSEQGVEATAFKTNLEAATEVGRQLRLRDLGGLIVIDFIDMRDRKHIRDVERRLKDALKTDKARVSVGRISQFGLMEMSRQRIKATLAEGSFLPCPHCEGTGQVKNAEAQALAVLRKIQGALAKGHIGTVEAEVPLEVASYLLNAKRQELLKLEHQHKASIFIHGRPHFVAGQADLTSMKREKEEEAQPEYVEGGTLIPAIEEEAAQPAAEAEGEAGAEAEAEGEGAVEEEGKKKRRRRRRRRRKGPAAEGEEAAAEAAEGEEAAKAEGEEKPEAAPAVVEVAAEEPKEAEAAPAEGEEAKRKPSRRRRTRKKPETEEKAAEAATPTAEEKPAEEKPAEAPAPAEAEEKPAEEAEKKPARKRRTRKKPEAEEKAVEAPVSPEAEEKAEAPAPALAEEKPAEEAEKKPARKRRTTKKKAEEAPAPAVTEEKAEAPAPAVEAKGEKVAAEEAEKKPARKRRTTKKKVEEAPAPAVAEEKAEAPAPAVEAKGEKVAAEEAEKKPARKRRTTKKKAEEAPAVAAEAKEEKIPAEEAEKKPARKKRATKKAEEAPAVAGAKEEKVAAEEAEKKPAPKKRATKKKAEEAPAATEEAEKKPAPKKRATKKKAEEAPAAAEAEKKPAPKKRATKKKAEEAPAAAEAEKKPAPKKRATKKKAEEAPAAAESEKKPAPKKRATKKKAEEAPAAAESEKKPAPKKRVTKKKAEEAPAETTEKKE